jgi:hypothetical protein
MNKSNFVHAAWALLIQLLVFAFTRDWVTGAAAGIFFFLGREHAQAERRIAGSAPVSLLKWWQGFTGWTTDSFLDLAMPAVACTLIAVAL